MLGNKLNLLGKISCIILVLNLASCGGGTSSGGDSSTPNVTQPPTTTPAPTTITPPIITPTYSGVMEAAAIDLNSVKPLILDVIYALDTANILVFGAEKRRELLRPENDFKNISFSEEDECSSGSQNIDFREFAEKIQNRETVDIVGESFKVTYSHCAIGNFVLSGTAELFVKGFDNENFNLTSFNLYIDKTLELTIDSESYQLEGTIYSNTTKEFTLDILLTTSSEHQNIYLSEFSIKDLSTEPSLNERLYYNGDIYFSQIGKVTISSNNNEQFYTFSGKNENHLIFDFSELSSRHSNYLGFVKLELVTSYYSYPSLSFYLGDLKQELFITGSNMNAFKAPNIFQFIFSLGAQLEIYPEDPPTISDFIKQEWQLTHAPDGIDKSINYGPKVTYKLTEYGDYTLKHVITNSTGDKKTFYKGFSVPKPSNINATIQVETPNWQLGNKFQAKVVSESTSNFTASLAFGPSGMTVTEEGQITWDGDFFDFGSSSKLYFGVYVETAAGKSLVKHTLVIESKLDKKQFKLAHATYDTALYPDDINKHRSKFLYKKNNAISYAHTIGDYGFNRLDVSASSVDIDYLPYDGDSFALTLFDVSYNSSNDAIDYLLLQNTLYPGELDDDRLKIETDLPWVLFNSNKPNNYVEVTGHENARTSDVINKIDAQFIELNSNNSDMVYSNANTYPDKKLKLVDQNFAVQAEFQNSRITKVIKSCKLSENEEILISHDNYVHVKNNDMTLHHLLPSLNTKIWAFSVFTLDQDNNNYCDTLLFVSNLFKQAEILTKIEAFQINSLGQPIKKDFMETDRLYSFQQLKTIYDVNNSSQNIIMFDQSRISNESINAFIFSLSADNRVVRKPLVYGSGLGIELSPNKSHIINLVDTDNDGIDEVIIKHNLSENEKLIEQYAQLYSEDDNNFEVHVIATLNNGVLIPTYVSELSIQRNKHISIDDKGDVIVGNGLQPFIVTPNKEVKAPNNIEQFVGNNILINNDGSRYQLIGTDLEKYSSSNELLWTTPNVPTGGSNKYTQLRILGKYQDVVLINYGYRNDLHFINDNTGELILQPNNIDHYSISPDFHTTGLLFFDFRTQGSNGAIKGSGVYRVSDLTGIELVHNWHFSLKYRINSMKVSWINIDNDADFELLFRLHTRNDTNEALTADYNGDNQRVYPFTEYMNPTDDLSRSAAWDIKKQGYFSYDTYRSKLTGEIIWQIPVNSFFSDTRYKNGIKQIAVSDNNLYLFETK